MTEQKFYSPLKIGLLTVAIAYFLFTLHGMLTLEWIGEWDRFGNGFLFNIFIEDITGFVGIVFRFVGSLIAFAGITFYFVKKSISAPLITKLLRWILVLEAIYWIGLATTGAYSVYGFLRFRDPAIMSILESLTLSVIPVLMESIVLPIVLLITAYKLSPNKPVKGAIKWGLITGTIYVTVFWLVNTSLWVSTIDVKGMEYITTHPENLLSFAVTIFGLFALTVFTAYFTKKSIGTETLEKLKLKTVGAIIIALGLFFLWNYLTWIFFGRNEIWSSWYAWFLGHDLDLWLLAIPLVGLPLLFERKEPE